MKAVWRAANLDNMISLNHDFLCCASMYQSLARVLAPCDRGAASTTKHGWHAGAFT